MAREQTGSRLIPALLIAVVGACVYAGSFNGPFVYDDYSSIVDNHTIRSLWPISGPLSPKPDTAAASRPIYNLTLAMNYALGEFNPQGYHAVNLFFHIASTLLLFGIVRRTLHCDQVPERFARTSTSLALAAALIWTTHPLQTSAVAYLTQRNELMMAFFTLLTLYCCIRGWSGHERRGFWFAAAVGACALGMGSKETTAAAPLVVLLYDRTFVSRTFGASCSKHRWLYVCLAATWVIVLALALPGGRARAVGFGFGITAWDYLRTQAGVILHYLRLTIWPHPLSIAYGFHIETDPLVWLPRGLVIVALMGWTVFALLRRLWIGFLGACFFIILAPSSSFLPLAAEIIAEKRMYLPLATIVIVMVVVVHDLLTRAASSRHARSGAGTALLIAVVVALGVTSILRIRDYRSEESIWRAAIEAVPDNDVAHAGLGYVLLKKGSPLEAFEQARRTLEIRADNIPAMMLAGRAASKLGDYPTATEYYTMGFRATGGSGWDVRSLLAKAHTKHALQLLNVDRSREAAEQFRAALEAKSDFLIPLNGLARLQATHPNPALRDGVEALTLARRACALTHYAEPAMLDTLAAAHAENGDFDKAIDFQQKSIELLTTAGRDRMLTEARARLGLYTNHKPFRMGQEQEMPPRDPDDGSAAD